MGALVYVRVSTTEQAREGLSLGVQEARCRAYAELEGLDVVGVVVDGGESGKDLRRPGVQKLLSRLPDADVSAVVVLKLDRLCRSMRDLLDLLDVFEARGVAFHSVSEKLDTSNAMGRFFVQLTGALAELERGIVCERVQGVVDSIRLRGFHSGKAPVGWVLVSHDGPGSLLRPASEQWMIRLRDAILLSDDGVSMREIARRLRIPHHSTVQRLLKSPLPGELVYHADADAYSYPVTY